MKTKTIRIFAVAAALAAGNVTTSAVAQTSAAKGVVQNSVQTVDQLLTLENQKALSIANREAAKLAKEEAAAKQIEAAEAALASANSARGKASKSGATKISVNVEAIFGVAGQLRADLRVGGRLYQGVTAGQVVGQCGVQSIDKRSIAMIGSDAKVDCPAQVAWTGIPVIQPPASAGPLGGAQAGSMQPGSSVLLPPAR